MDQIIDTIKSTGHDPTPDDSDNEDITIPLPKRPTHSEVIDIPDKLQTPNIYVTFDIVIIYFIMYEMYSLKYIK